MLSCLESWWVSKESGLCDRIAACPPSHDCDATISRALPTRADSWASLAGDGLAGRYRRRNKARAAAETSETDSRAHSLVHNRRDPR